MPANALLAAYPPILTGTNFITSILHTPSVRNNAGFNVGMKVTIGAAGCTVSKIGRMIHTGNSQTHSLSIFNAAGSSLGAITINAALGTPGSFLYGTLGTPIVLSASTSYYFYSAENSGGDTWANTWGSASVTYTSIASAMQNAYNQGSGNTDGGSSNDPYGPLDFVYT